MKIVTTFLYVSLLQIAAPSSYAFAHAGGLNAEGCHTNRKTGEYHCHRGKAPPPAQPAQLVAQRNISSESSNSSEIRFSSCREAREAGAAPLKRGEPGYSETLDRDRDGVACE